MVATVLGAALAMVAGGCSHRPVDYGGGAILEGTARRADRAESAILRGAAAVAIIETDVARGMGFVIDPAGYLLTNRHVIEDADHIEGVVFPARDPNRVFGSVRKEADAERLRDELGEAVVPLRFDVTDGEAIAAAAKQVEQTLEGTNLEGLVNNAGVAVPGPILHLPIDELRQQFEINVFGLIAVSQAFIPLLGARKGATGTPGRVVNISSVSGRIVVPFLGAYAGSKHAVEALSEHPLASAIIAAVHGPMPAVSDFSAIPGHGLRGIVDGQVILVGAARLLTDTLDGSVRFAY